MIDRRTFIGSLALGTLALPFGVRAQQVGKTYRIGMLWAGKPAENVSRENAFRDGLRTGVYDAITPDAIRPAFEERKANPRSRSAKLRWARKKYKRYQHQRRATHWLRGLARRQPGLFAHWALGALP